MKEVSEQLTESVQSMRITCTVSETPLSEPGLVWQMDLQGNVFPSLCCPFHGSALCNAAEPLVLRTLGFFRTFTEF